MPSKTSEQIAAQLMVRAIEEGLIELLGAPAAKALSFHVDPQVASESPREYEERLRQILSDGSKVVIMKLKDRMCELSGQKPKPDCVGIQNCLQCIIDSHSQPHDSNPRPHV